MDTPGGLDTSMRDIIKAILASPVPVVTYVAPSGARAASAGTYILYASHFAAMAPATNLGAATPISIGGEPSAPPPSRQPDRRQEAENARGDLLQARRASVKRSMMPSRTSVRWRNCEAAMPTGREAAVREAASLSADDALEQHVDRNHREGCTGSLAAAAGTQGQSGGARNRARYQRTQVRSIAPDWRTRMLLVLTHPTIAYGLLLVGIYGLLLEGYNPGAVLPGVVGALSLLLGLYGLQLLAVNYAGLALMALGIGLIVAEFFMPAFGSLGVGGLAAFVVGSIILFDNNASGLEVALPLIAGVAVAGGLLVVIIGWLAARARRRPLSAGVETMVGATVEAVSDCQDRCVVRYGGELWNARTASPLRAGQQARIIKVVDLTLWVDATGLEGVIP